MAPQEEHDTAIRRIKKAEENRSTELNLAGEDHARELSVDKYFREAWSPWANEREIVSKARRTLTHTKIRSLPHPSNRRTPAWRNLDYRKYGVILPEV